MMAGSKYMWAGDEEDEELMLEEGSYDLNQQSQPPAPTTTTTTTSSQPPQLQQQQPPKVGFFSSLFGSSSSSAPSNRNINPTALSGRHVPPAPVNGGKRVAPVKTTVKKANTNVLVVNLGSVAKESSIQTGDGFFCKKCKAGFSNINALKEIQMSDGKLVPNVPTSGGLTDKIWKCEFCSEDNEILIDSEEIPKTNIIDYILESEPIGDTNNNQTKEEKEKDKKEKDTADNSFVIFCIDISGSMEVTQNVSNLQLPTSICANVTDEEAGKKLKSVNYVSRLQCVQLGLLSQIEDIAEKYPNKRVGLVTFNDKVTLIGDGTTTPVTLKSTVLNDLPQLIEDGSSFSFSETISKTKSSLLTKVQSLRGDGSTALGSAVAACIGITGSSRGSQIIICTDGQSNLGLGSNGTPESQQAAFEQLGNMAQRSGTSISVLTIKGTDTKLEYIGKLANTTGGEVNTLDPLNLNEGFSSILSVPTLATNVSIKLFLHSGLYISENGKRTETSFNERTIGNVNQDTTVSFEYGVKSSKLIDKSLKSIPFQLQIYYTTLTGKKCVRMITQTQEVTTDVDLAEEFANVEAIGINMVQTSSKIASTGDYEQSRAKNIANASLMNKVLSKKKSIPTSSKNAMSNDEMETCTAYLQQAQVLETQLSHTVQKESSKPSSGGDKFKSRQNQRDDATANMLYNMNSMSNTKSKKSYI